MFNSMRYLPFSIIIVILLEIFEWNLFLQHFSSLHDNLHFSIIKTMKTEYVQYMVSFPLKTTVLTIIQQYWIMQCSFWLHKTLIEWCGSLVDYCDVFISCLDSHSDGTHSLQRIHWWASDGMLYISPNLFPWRNKLIYILDGLRVSKF